MQKILTLAAIGVFLLLTACGRAEAPGQTRVAPEQATDAPAAESTTPETTEPKTIPEFPEGTFSLRTLPGMMMSDVYVRLWDGDIAPGLRAEDAETVKRILSAQTWGDSFDNLSDTWIEAENVTYAYDTQSGILTSADDHAAKLLEPDRVQINAILSEYLPGYEEGVGFSGS